MIYFILWYLLLYTISVYLLIDDWIQSLHLRVEDLFLILVVSIIPTTGIVVKIKRISKSLINNKIIIKKND